MPHRAPGSPGHAPGGSLQCRTMHYRPRGSGFPHFGEAERTAPRHALVADLLASEIDRHR